MSTRTSRVAEDLLAAAEVEAARESRSVRAQLDHWTRVGMHVSMRHTAARRRIEGAVAGDLPLSELSAEEQVIVNAEISAAVSAAANEMSFADRLAAEGVTTVSVGSDGSLVRRAPDGSTTALLSRLDLVVGPDGAGKSTHTTYDEQVPPAGWPESRAQGNGP